MTIGQIFFAYADPFEVFNPLVHNVEDEKVFNLRLSQNEGEFAQAEIEIQNPQEGLLAPTRKQRVFISADIDNVVTLLFSGRVVGFPEDPSDQTVTLRYIAQPDDWLSTQDTFIQTLKVAPFYSPLFTPEEQRDDPAEVLAARASLLHWNRATGALTLSNIIEGSQTIDLDDGFLFDSLDMQIGDPPLAGIDLEIEAQWNQLGVGEVNVGAAIKAQFGNPITTEPIINTLTPIAFEKGWEGVRVPTGYSVLESQLVPIANGFGLAQANLRSGQAVVAGADYPTSTGTTPVTRQVSVPRVWYLGKLFLQANYEQKRREVLRTTLNVATQALSLSNDAVEKLSIRLQDPTAEIQGAVLDIGKPSFFMNGAVFSAYGQDALEHALLRGHSRLLKSSRVVETTVQARLQDLININCDYNVRVADDRIPGGEIRGKVVSYQFAIEGQSGNSRASVTFASVIGTGVDSAGSGGTVGTTVFTNEFGPANMTSEIFFELAAPPVIIEPIDVDLMESDPSYLVDAVTVDNDGQSQNGQFVVQALPDTYLGNSGTRIEVELKSMNPEPELLAEIDVTCSTLTLPKQVNLE